MQCRGTGCCCNINNKYGKGKWMRERERERERESISSSVKLLETQWIQILLCTYLLNCIVCRGGASLCHRGQATPVNFYKSYRELLFITAHHYCWPHCVIHKTPVALVAGFAPAQTDDLDGWTEALGLFMCIYILPCARRPGPGRESVCEYCKWHSDSVSVRQKRFTFFRAIRQWVV